MKSKIISDIRIFKSAVPNVDSSGPPSEYIESTDLFTTIKRIVMKLRENGFSLGDFDHLYLNFTTCLKDGEIMPADRSRDYYHPWYRYYDIGVDEAFYAVLDEDENLERIIARVKQTLMQYFVTDAETAALVESCFKAALEQKEQMLMCFKVKETATRRAVVYLRCLDSGYFFPLLCVYDTDGKELLRKDLEPCMELNAFGVIQLSNKKVSIKPRENALSHDLEPITFTIGHLY